jgi:hypothetical protein
MIMDFLKFTLLEFGETILKARDIDYLRPSQMSY